MAEKTQVVEQAVVNVSELHHAMTRLNNRLGVVGETEKERDAKKLLNELEQARKLNRSRVELFIPVETPNPNNERARLAYEAKTQQKQAPVAEPPVSAHVSQSDELHRATTEKNKPENLKNAPPIADSGGSGAPGNSGAADASAPGAGAPTANSAASTPAPVPAPVQATAPVWKG